MEKQCYACDTKHDVVGEEGWWWECWHCGTVNPRIDCTPEGIDCDKCGLCDNVPGPATATLVKEGCDGNVDKLVSGLTVVISATT